MHGRKLECPPSWVVVTQTGSGGLRYRPVDLENVERDNLPCVQLLVDTASCEPCLHLVMCCVNFCSRVGLFRQSTAVKPPLFDEHGTQRPGKSLDIVAPGEAGRNTVTDRSPPVTRRYRVHRVFGNKIGRGHGRESLRIRVRDFGRGASRRRHRTTKASRGGGDRG